MINCSHVLGILKTRDSYKFFRNLHLLHKNNAIVAKPLLESPRKE